MTISQAGGYNAPDGNNYKYGPFGPALGVYYGNMRQGGYQLAAQLCGISFALGWSFCWTFVICKVRCPCGYFMDEHMIVNLCNDVMSFILRS